MIDGQDINDPSVAGGQQSINNPDIVQPAQRISVYSLDRKERDGLVEKIVIGRIQYSDGTSWQRPDTQGPALAAQPPR